MDKYLNEFIVGENGVVLKITAEGKIKRRLFDMGVTPGANITLKKIAPLGDPIQVLIRGYDLTLRRDEAKTVLMEVKRWNLH